MTEADDRLFDSFQVGEMASFDRLVSERDVDSFAELSGDYNPLHMDDAYALSTPFRGRIVHSMFLGGLLSRLAGMYLPGKRALLMKESLEFKKPVRIGDTVAVSARLISKSVSTRIIEIEISFSTSAGIAASGTAHVRVLG